MQRDIELLFENAIIRALEIQPRDISEHVPSSHRESFILFQDLFRPFLGISVHGVNGLYGELLSTFGSVATGLNRMSDLIQIDLSECTTPHDIQQKIDGAKRQFESDLGMISAKVPLLLWCLRSMHSDIGTEQYLLRSRMRARGLMTDIEKAVSEIQAQKDRMQEMLKGVAVSSFADVFSEESTKHLGLAIVAGGVAAWILLTCFSNAEAFVELALQSKSATDYLAARIPLIAVAAFSLGVFTKISFSSWHNHIVAKQRHLAMRTYRAFVEGNPNEGVPTAVLEKALDSVFSHNATGFSKEPTSFNVESIIKSLKTSG